MPAVRACLCMRVYVRVGMTLCLFELLRHCKLKVNKTWLVIVIYKMQTNSNYRLACLFVMFCIEGLKSSIPLVFGALKRIRICWGIVISFIVFDVYTFRGLCYKTHYAVIYRKISVNMFQCYKTLLRCKPMEKWVYLYGKMCVFMEKISRYDFFHSNFP